MIVYIVFASVFLINIIFGYWRSNTRRFSPQWIMAIHIPVPLAIALRLSFLGWNWFQLPIFVGAFAAGQFMGGRIRHWMKKSALPVSSFLIADLGKAMIYFRNNKL
jgi:hypothetical protein